MSYIAKLHEGRMLVRLMPMPAPHVDILTPRMTPARLMELDPDPAPSLEVDRWVWTGKEQDGFVTADFWMATFGIRAPDDMDPRTMKIPVRWLHYERREHQEPGR